MGGGGGGGGGTKNFNLVQFCMDSSQKESDETTHREISQS